MRTLKNIHQSAYTPIADLITYSPLPSRGLRQIDPFLFLNHHGPQIYPPNNRGLPFGPHPHRGMETVTFILSGDIMHKDSAGHESVIGEGGIQWMTAGSGLIHSEVSSDHFKKQGGKLEILQLWLNLPSKSKMNAPQFSGFQNEQIPVYNYSSLVDLKIISGTFGDHKGAFRAGTDVHLNLIHFKESGLLDMDISKDRNILFYIVSGRLLVNTIEVNSLHLVEFNNDHEHLRIDAIEESVLLIGHAPPLNEPLVAQGPFVMNSEEEIKQAYDDYRNGKFGEWKG